MVAYMRMGVGRLGLASNRADHLGADLFGPLAGDGANAAGRRMNQNKLTRQNREHVMKEKIRSDPLLQGGCGDRVVNSVRHGNEPVGCDEASVRATARTD